MTAQATFAAKLKQASQTSEAQQTQVSAKDVRKKKQKEAAKEKSIQANPFYEAWKNAPSSQEKMDQMEKLLTYTNREEAEKNHELFKEFTAFLMNTRLEMSKQLIEASDTELFSNMQQNIMGIADEVLDFNSRIDPFMLILEANSALQEAGGGATLDLVEAIRKEEQQMEQWKRQADNLLDGIADRHTDNMEYKEHIANLMDDRSWFGFGGVKASAQERINQLKETIKKNEEQNAKDKAASDELRTRKVEDSSLEKLTDEHKRTLTDFLSKTPEEINAEQEELLATTKSFVDTAGSRVESTLDQAEGMGVQVKKLNDMSFNLGQTYTILSEASKKAKDANASIHSEIQERYEEVKDQDRVQAMELEQELKDISKHVKLTTETNTDTTQVLNELMIDQQRIEHMADSNEGMVNTLHRLQTSSVSGVANNLAVTIQGMGATAIKQAEVAANQGIQLMNEKTMQIGTNQMIAAAAGKQEELVQLQTNLDQMSNMIGMVNVLREDATDTVEKAHNLTVEMAESAEEAKDALRGWMSTSAEVVNDNK